MNWLRDNWINVYIAIFSVFVGLCAVYGFFYLLFSIGSQFIEQRRKRLMRLSRVIKL